MPPRKGAAPQELDETLDEQDRQLARIRRAIERPGGAFTANSSCDDFLFRGHAETTGELKEPIAQIAKLVRGQRARARGFAPDRVALFERIEAGERLGALLNEKGIEDEQERANLYRSFYRWRDAMRRIREP
jgi:hypothetical protein